jgi:beta-barrel assembly-enhancing protease
MNEADPIYPGGAFEGDDDSAAVVGQITVSMFALRFESEGFTLDLPTRALQMWLDDTGDRVFFAHDNFPGWTVYSLDPAILEHHSLNQPFLKKRILELTQQRSQPPTHAKRVYGAFAAIVAVLIAMWAFTDPIIGVIVNMMPEEWETKVGKEAFAEVREIFPLTEEPALTNRVHLVAQRLKKGLPHDAPKFRFHVSDFPLVNAIAVPGGDVIVLQGLLEEATPDELAAVLAHEMSHVIEKHAMRQIAQDAGPSFISKYIFGGDSALSALLAGTSAIGQLQYSRHNEKSADKMAFSILLNANIDPRSLAKFFEKLDRIEKQSGDDSDFLSTHPPTMERIKYLQTLWDESPKKSGFQPVNAGPDIPPSTKSKLRLFF